MSEDVRAIIKGNRGNPPVMTQIWTTAITMQLDKMSVQEATSYEGADPHFLYSGFTVQLPVSNPQLLQQHDELIDQGPPDVVTGLPRRYRIISDPECFPDMHWEFDLHKYRGGN